jgi:hypothetical protein
LDDRPNFWSALIESLFCEVEDAERFASYGVAALGFVEDDDVGSNIAEFFGFVAEFRAG